MPPLKWDDGLALAARDHCEDIGSKGLVTHTGSDASQIYERVQRYGRAQGMQAENLSFGSVTGQEHVMALFLDDGVPGRRHRANIWSADFGATGIASCRHTSQYKNVVVIVYAGGFKINQNGIDKVRHVYD